MKVEKEDLREIYDHFERFALYEDLKDLNKKVIPEIQKFEKRLIEINKEISKQNEIVRELDLALTTKSNKQSLLE